jgi:organic radical activating enzyme
MTQKIIIDKLEFYITNVCNLTCSDCNRYNNYKFAGWDHWDDYEEIFEQWAKKIDIIKPVILGGEPLLNPSINKWIAGLYRLWPNGYSPQVQSNGTRIDLVDGLYETCRATRGWVGISLHRLDDREAIFKRIRNFLKAPIYETQNTNSPHGSTYQFIDENKVQIHVWINDQFNNSNIIEVNGQFRLYNSNPDRAHEICTFRKFKNYHMIHGKIYKCGPVALMPEFDDQYPFDLSDEDRAIMRGYRGLAVDEFDTRGVEFLDTIDSVIPQCKFCPESYDYKPITFSTLKPNKI